MITRKSMWKALINKAINEGLTQEKIARKLNYKLKSLQAIFYNKNKNSGNAKISFKRIMKHAELLGYNCEYYTRNGEIYKYKYDKKQNN